MKREKIKITVLCVAALLVLCLSAAWSCEGRHWHVYGAWTVTTSATCTADGVETRVCLTDKSHIETRVVAALGHDYNEWAMRDPACTEEGVEMRVCAREKNHTEKRPLALSGHNFDADGVCSACNIALGSSYTVPIPLTLEALGTTKGSRSWFKFTAPSDGLYKIFSEKIVGNPDVSTSLYLCHENNPKGLDDDIEFLEDWGWDGSATNQQAVSLLDAGDSLYIMAYARYSIMPETEFTVGVESIIPAVIDLDTEKSTVSGEECWFKFTAPADGIYAVFSDDNSSPENYGNGITVYDASADYLTSDDANYLWDGYAVVFLEANEEIYLKIYNLYSTAIGSEFALRVEVVNPVTIEIGTPQTAISGKANWYIFTAPSDGIYTVFSDDDPLSGFDAVFFMYHTDGGYVQGGSINTATRDSTVILKAGTVLFLEVYGELFETEFTVGIGTIDPAPIQLNTPQTAISGNCCWFKFIAPADDIYTIFSDTDRFTSGIDADIRIYDANGSRLLANGTTSASALLRATGEPTFILVSDRWTEAAGTEFSVIARAETTVIDFEHPAALIARQTTWLKFTAPENGSYVLFSESLQSFPAYDIKVTVYNLDGIFLFRDSILHFDVEDIGFDLKANETVYIQTVTAGSNFTLKITAT